VEQMGIDGVWQVICGWQMDRRMHSGPCFWLDPARPAYRSASGLMSGDRLLMGVLAVADGDADGGCCMHGRPGPPASDADTSDALSVRD
jgi:hypothetical protein